MADLKKYSSIVPSAMSSTELNSMCVELSAAKDIGKDRITVHLTPLGLDYNVDVADLVDYTKAFITLNL